MHGHHRVALVSLSQHATHHSHDCPAPEPYSQACNLRREMLREQHVQSLWAAANRPASIEAAKQGRNQ